MLTLQQQLDNVLPTAMIGSVVETAGTTCAVADFPAPVGSVATIDRAAREPVQAEVIGFRDHLTLVVPLSGLEGVQRGSRVSLLRTMRTVAVGPGLLGRTINARGVAIDGKPQPLLPDRAPLDRRSPPPVDRPRIDTPLATGIRAIDGLLTCGRGQRMGIFAGSGVGKSVLLGMMARYTNADVNVIALVGERGREVNEFLHRDLGAEGLQRSIVVVATSDEPALLRINAAYAATAIAEYFRSRGQDVLLLMDSLTRFAMAQREIGLAAGEPPTTRGYPPSVFSLLPRLVERTGRTPHGSITAFYSVLVEGDDANEPVADAVRGLLDGHTWLSRPIAMRGHYPAIDVLDSISRLMVDVAEEEQLQAATAIRELLAAYRNHEDLLSIGAYRAGSNPVVDAAVDLLPAIQAFLKQRIDEPADPNSVRTALLKLGDQCRRHRGGPAATPPPTSAQNRPPRLPQQPVENPQH